MTYWIKLHDETIYNDVWLHDRTAWHIFEYLLIMAYKGKPQGTVTTSRYKIANATLSNNNAVYSALKRLKTAQMITTTATNRTTTIRICNWSKWQLVQQLPQQQLSNNTATTEQHSYKNKIKIKNNTTEKTFKKNTPQPKPISRASRESAERARKRLEERGLLKPKEQS